MNTLGVILARGGSKGLPHKHTRPLLGRAVLDYTIDHAFAAASLSRVVCSTDCADIRAVAARRFVESVLRPPALATDDASVQDAMIHALREVEARSRTTFDAVVVLYGNVPVRPAGSIDACLAKLKETGCDSVRTFCPVGKWHPNWMNTFDGDRVIPLHAGSIHRRQDLVPTYLHDGGCVAMTRASLLRGETNPADPHAMFGEDRRGVTTPSGGVVEVDEEKDLLLAESLLRGSGMRSVRMAS